MCKSSGNIKFDHKHFIQTLTHAPGVYRLLNIKGELLYIGKAKDLKKRVATYFSKKQQSPRIAKVASQTANVEITITNTEAEALLLENNLIKQHRPRYNILLRDDKSYPYIFISSNHRYPQITFHRGRRNKAGKYFGPYASAGATRNALGLLQKIFKTRQCDDSFFNHRRRPCLQHQINRCSAPCVGLIDEDVYGNEIKSAIEFLEGKSHRLINRYVQGMNKAADTLDYEKAADFRNKIELLRKISEQQYVSLDSGNVDVIAIQSAGDIASVQVFNIRAGVNLGNKSYFPRLPESVPPEKILAAFIGQYYLTHAIPKEIISSHQPVDAVLLQKMLSTKAGKNVSIICSPRSKRAQWLSIAKKNAATTLQGKLASKASLIGRFEALQEELELEFLPMRIECFDVSHTRGESTVASCVVFEQTGPVKDDYRRFNVEAIKAGDDYAAIHQALTRRYTRLKKSEGKFPDILLVDGGRGQVNKASEVMHELQVEGIQVIGIAKGIERRPGHETLFFSDDRKPLNLTAHSLALRLIQQIRDEAHRFAIAGHRRRRTKSRMTSPLEGITGLGPKRRQNLLKYFGGMRGVTQAGEEEIAKVPGISKGLAQAIYQQMHLFRN